MSTTIEHAITEVSERFPVESDGLDDFALRLGACAHLAIEESVRADRALVAGEPVGDLRATLRTIVEALLPYVADAPDQRADPWSNAPDEQLVLVLAVIGREVRRIATEGPDFSTVDRHDLDARRAAIEAFDEQTAAVAATVLRLATGVPEVPMSGSVDKYRACIARGEGLWR